MIKLKSFIIVLPRLTDELAAEPPKKSWTRSRNSCWNEKSLNPFSRFWCLSKILQLCGFLLHWGPETFNETVTHPTPLTVHRASDTNRLQCAGKFKPGELSNLVSAEIHRHAITFYGSLQGSNILITVHGVWKRPGTYGRLYRSISVTRHKWTRYVGFYAI